MKLAAFKYLLAYIIPVTALYSFNSNNYWTFSTLILAFGIFPFLELLIKPFSKNLPKEEITAISRSKIFSFIAYLSVPIQLYCLYEFFEHLNMRELNSVEIIGYISSMGIVCGVIAINIAHELGHRKNRFEQFLAEILLLTSLENHFIPYHNMGHHLNVGSVKDPATARKNETLYFFWIRSHFTGYFQAWQLEFKRAAKKKSIFANRMIWYTLSQIVFLSVIYMIYGQFALLMFIAAASFGILLLETVNYIEHYGLLRQIKENGKLERVQANHSWNSNHIIGRTILYELLRHSDHHYMASMHYQILDSLENSPQMPTGYPGMMLLSLIPALWFRVMNKRLQKI